MNILVLSPHRNDAAFSLSLSIAHWLAVGHRVTLLNIFSRSLDAPYSDADFVHENDRLTYVSAMRKKEDESFLKRLPGLSMIDLNLKDAPIRLRCDRAIVCDMDANPNDAAIPKIHKALTTQGEATRPIQALVIPFALGHHVDHCVVRDAALSFTTNLPTAFYEDLPYAAREGVHIDPTFFREPLHPVLVHGTQPEPVPFKLKMARLYASQIDDELAHAIASFSHRYQGAERLWANDLWFKDQTSNKLSRAQLDEAVVSPFS